MLIARPLQAFTLGGRHILSCKVVKDNPHMFVGKEMWFYSAGSIPKQIRIEGLSTASDIARQVYDFHYTGAVVCQEEIIADSILTDEADRQGIK